MKEYTLVFYVAVGRGLELATYKHVTTDNLAEEIKDLDVAIVFEGHCQETSD